MEVILSKNAKKHYDQLPAKEQKKIKKNLEALILNPLAGKKLSGDLSRDRSLRSWPYRIIYSINKAKERIEVSDILHRQGAYK